MERDGTLCRIPFCFGLCAHATDTGCTRLASSVESDGRATCSGLKPAMGRGLRRTSKSDQFNEGCLLTHHLAGDDQLDLCVVRAARDLASMLGTVSVAGVDISSRVTRSDQTTEGTVQRHFAVDRSESSRLFKSVLEGMKQEAEWIDPEGRWSGKEGRVFYFLYSYPKP